MSAKTGAAERLWVSSDRRQLRRRNSPAGEDSHSSSHCPTRCSAIEIPGRAHQFIAHPSPNGGGRRVRGRIRSCVNACHLKFGGDESSKTTPWRRASRGERHPARELDRAQICFDGFQPPARSAPAAIQPDGMKRPKNREPELFPPRACPAKLPEASAPIRQNGRNPVLIFFRDELVENLPAF